MSSIFFLNRCLLSNPPKLVGLQNHGLKGNNFYHFLFFHGNQTKESLSFFFFLFFFMAFLNTRLSYTLSLLHAQPSLSFLFFLKKKKVSLFYLFFIILSLDTRQLCNCLKHLKILITKQINSFLVITNKLCCKHKLCWCSLNSFFF